MSSIKDSSNNLDYYKVVNQLHSAITQLNSNHKIDVANVYGNMQMNQLYGSSSIEDVQSTDKRMITIKNPENLNGNVPRIAKGWNIEYQGRDLSLDVDNYRWDVWSNYNTARGYWIIERELVMGDWLNVRWGLNGIEDKERKELIDKSRLRDKSMIQRDMITAIVADINTIK